jgi:predicted transcriptional regulator
MTLKEEAPLSTDEIAEKTEVNEDDIDERLKGLEEMGKIRGEDGSGTHRSWEVDGNET